MKKILSFLFIYLFVSPAFGAQNYCKPEDEQSKFIIHIFGESYHRNEDKRQFLKGIEKLQIKFKRGDKIRVVIHVGLESQTKLDQCLPGCEAKSIVDSLISNDCSMEIAKRDMVIFKKNYITLLKQALSLSSQNYNVLDHMSSLDNFYRGRNIDGQQTLVFHSLLPSKVDPTIASSFDKSFINSIQSNKLNLISLPNLNFVNPNRSINTLKFWEDLKLKGDKTGLKIKFKTKIID